MRRISLALALLGAAAAGCGGSTPNDQGGARGVAEGTFTVMVQNGQNGNTSLAITGGVVTSVPAGINCGVGLPVAGCSFEFPADSTVVLTAAATVAGQSFFEWSGDCQGVGTCTLTGKSDKYVLARFGTPADRGSHPNWSDPAVHAAQFRSFALQCNACHGLNWNGLAIAPSCYGCHSGLDSVKVNTDPLAVDGHFAQDAGAWHDHDGWSSSCTRCHTSEGFQDYVGLDGTPNYLDGTFKPTNTLASTTVACETAGTCDPLAPNYGPLTCKTCHNSKSDPIKAGITQILFPSLKQVTTDRSTALCGQCHGARESSVSVDAAVAPATGPDAQINAAGVSFKNPHYLGAAATLFGADAAGWAQYAGRIYTGTNKHGVIEGSCTSCHDAHTGHLPADADMAATCGKCHFNEAGAPVASYLELEESRQFGFEGDIDGDAVEESLKAEIEGLEVTLYAAMQDYATTVAGTSICYSDSYPYFMKDDGTGPGAVAGDGVCTPASCSDPLYTDKTTCEANAGTWSGETVAFKQFTPRLMRAAYNFKFAHAEPGAWAHNPRYVIEILFDAIKDLNEGLGTPFTIANVTDLFRSFDGHFGGARAAAPYRAFVYSAFPNTSGFSSAACYQCHGGQVGFEQYLASSGTGAGLTTAGKVTGMQCTTCHAPAAGDVNFARIRTVGTVYFPPGKNPAATPSPAQVSFAAADLPAGFTVCATCHSGRENAASIDNKIGTATDADWTLSFVNPHYLGAAGVLLGTNAKMLYEYAGQTYFGNPVNWGSPYGSPHGASCTGCHQPKVSKHTFEVDLAYCATCHTPGGAYDLAVKKLEVEELAEQLYTAIKAYATANSKTVCYNGASHPYWFADDDSDGTCATSAGSALLNPKALKAAYNFKWAHAEPGAYAHNFEYMVQALFDSIVDLGGTPMQADGVTPLVRPEVPVTP